MRSLLQSGGRALAFALMVLSGCSEEPANGSNSNAQPLSCTPSELRPCACIGAVAMPVMGMQMCNALGNGYGACEGCPAPSSGMAGDSGGAGAAGTLSGTSGGMGDAGAAGALGMAGVSGAAGAMSTAGVGGESGMMSTAGEGGVSGASGSPDASEPEPAGDVEPGVSCGVGLVVQCAPTTEKCCARSLEVDTCIPTGESCGCSLPGCTVMEARCDGPEDCGAGEVCCGTLAANSAGYTSFVCATTCQSRGNQRIACHEQDSKCPAGDICANSQLLTNTQVCIDPATIRQ